MAKKPEPADLTPAFKLIFTTVVAMTVLSLAASIFLALYDARRPTENLKQLIETCSTTWKLGFGAIIGLVGGKVTYPPTTPASSSSGSTRQSKPHRPRG